MFESKSPREFDLHLANYAQLDQHAVRSQTATSRGEVGPKIRGILRQQGRPPPFQEGGPRNYWTLGPSRRLSPDS